MPTAIGIIAIRGNRSTPVAQTVEAGAASRSRWAGRGRRTGHREHAPGSSYSLSPAPASANRPSELPRAAGFSPRGPAIPGLIRMDSKRPYSVAGAIFQPLQAPGRGFFRQSARGARPQQVFAGRLGRRRGVGTPRDRRVYRLIRAAGASLVTGYASGCDHAANLSVGWRPRLGSATTPKAWV